MISHVGHHYQPTLWDALKTCACPRKFTLLASSFGAKVTLSPNVGVRFWFGLTQESSICLMPFDNPICSTHYVCDTISWNFLAFISLASWCGTFMWFPTPLKERWCPHHVLCLFCFFVGLMWNSFMASWACSISDSFIQDAFIGWYPFHLTKYLHFHSLDCLDLSTASTSNSGSLWTKSGGGVELRSQLVLEASWATGFKRETWNVR
jgi:hypothetical protein